MKDNRISVMLSIDRMIIGGAEQQLLELAKGLDRRIFRLIVVTLFPGGSLEPEIKSIPDTEYICLNRKHKFDFSILFKIMRILKKERVDIIQPFLTPVKLFTLLPAVICNTPVKILTERGNARKNSGLGYKMYLLTEDFLTRYADWVIPNSESGRNYIISRGISAGRIKKIYNGINLQRLSPDPIMVTEIRKKMNLPENGAVVGISASLIPLKDHATFLRAAKIISSVMPQVRFAILGDGPLRADLENMAYELNMDKVVHFMGNQTNISSYLDAFDIVCLCSAQPEGCSNAILEAMALGKPVVATDIGGNRELVKDGQTGLLVPFQNPKALADAVISCIKQPDWARQMGQQGKTLVLTEFGLQRMIKEYENLYLETLSKKIPGSVGRQLS